MKIRISVERTLSYVKMKWNLARCSYWKATENKFLKYMSSYENADKERIKFFGFEGEMIIKK